MRISSVFPLLALLTLAAPLHGQAPKATGDPVFRTPAFEIKLPPGFGAPVEQGLSQEGGRLHAHYALGPGAMVMVMQAELPARFPLDTTLAVQRQLLQFARTGMLQSAGYTETGEPREIVRADRLALRIPITMRMEAGESLHGTAELILPRGSEVSLWFVAYLGLDRATAETPAARRVLASFRLREGAFAAVRRDTTDVFRWVEGRWGWSNRENPCDDDPFTLAVAPDRGSVRLEYPRPQVEGDTARIFTYRVLGHGDDHIRGEIQGENQKDENGAPLVWDFVRMSRDVFCWRRDTWGSTECTAPLQRCVAAPAPRVPAAGEPPRRAVPGAGRASR